MVHRHLIAHRAAIAIAGAGQGEVHTACSAFSSCRRVHRIQRSVVRCEASCAAAPNTTGGSHYGTIQGDRAVVRAHRTIGHRVHRRCRREGDHTFIGYRIAIAVAGGAQGEREYAVGDLRSRWRVGRVQGRVVRREGSVAAAPHTTRCTTHRAVQGNGSIVRADRHIGTRVHRRRRREGEVTLSVTCRCTRPLPVVVKVSVTLPLAISAALGVYTAPRLVLLGA
jgi:hypothetical protein